MSDTKRRRRWISSWFESQLWWPASEFDFRLADAFFKVAAVMGEEEWRTFEEAAPVFDALLAESAGVVVPKQPATRAVIVFGPKSLEMRDNQLASLVARQVARVILQKRGDAEALAASWGFPDSTG